jgi:hypothetical protein
MSAQETNAQATQMALTMATMRRTRTFARLVNAGLSEKSIHAILPQEWTAQALVGREPNTGSPR